ncbi:VOC family protein [Horticoccus luteus]|uniref:VOC family protein n=1 Tax=Horticoccus luteus TaxID=2862869 RepID=A0A8F9TX48_9BACT|nr:VOC family protein [Horticoccus luteus]QYM79459.1 VOC family protein [Horticoccus luteus]
MLTGLAALMTAGLPAGVRAGEESPATPEAPTWRTGKFVWADLFTNDPVAAEAFYTGLFGWTAAPPTTRMTSRGEAQRYVILQHDGEPVAGIARHVSRHRAGKYARWVLYASVADLPQAVARATAEGGRVVLKPEAVGSRDPRAVLVDPQGAVIGLIHTDRGDGPDFQAEEGEWNWASLRTSDPEKARQFYARVFDYDVVPDTRTVRTNDYILASGTYARGSLQPLPSNDGARPAWLGFVRVADVDAAVKRAMELGGSTLLAAKDPRPNMRVAIIADPTGAAIGLVQVRSFETESEEEGAP